MSTIRLLCITTLLAFGAVALAANNVEFELRGETKNQVRSHYGDPESVRGPVGDPPITRWLYPDFTVVFEHDRVIHAFARQHELEKLPADALPSRPEQGDTLDMPE